MHTPAHGRAVRPTHSVSAGWAPTLSVSVSVFVFVFVRARARLCVCRKDAADQIIALEENAETLLKLNKVSVGALREYIRVRVDT